MMTNYHSINQIIHLYMLKNLFLLVKSTLLEIHGNDNFMYDKAGLVSIAADKLWTPCFKHFKTRLTSLGQN